MKSRFKGGVTGVYWPALPVAIMLLACAACGHNAVGLRQNVAWPVAKIIFKRFFRQNH